MRYSSALGEVFRALWDGGALAAFSDVELMKRFMEQRAESGELAFQTLLRRHGPMVFATCRRILRNEHEVEDAFQATFLVLVSKMRSIRGESLEPWLRKVARRVALRAKGTIDRRQARECADVDLAVIATQTGTNEDILGLALDELNQLPGYLRDALILCDLEGLTMSQAASKLRCPVGTVNSRLVRARQRVRKRLKRRGLELSGTTGCLTIPAGIKPIASTVPSHLIANTARLASLEAAGMAGEAVTSATVAELIRGTLRVMALRKIIGSVSLLLAVSIIGGIGLRALATQVNAPPPRPVAAASAAPTTEKSRLVRSLDLQPDPAAARDLLQSASPDSFRFVPSPERPPGIIKEPSYRSTPRYAVFRVGTGPRSTYAMAVDEPAGGDWRIYVDFNRNGDLSDDDDGRYDTVTKDQYDPFRMVDCNDMIWNDPEMTGPLRSTLREKFLMLRISRGTTDEETSSAPHGVSFRRVVYHREPLWNYEGTDYLRITGTAAGVGQLPDPLTKTIGDACIVFESVGLVYPMKLRPGMHFGAIEVARLKRTAQQAWCVHVKREGETVLGPGDTYKLNCSTGVMTYFGRRVEWKWRPDGSRVDIVETEKEQAPVFRVGSPAPGFDFELGDSRHIKLSDLHGKVVVLAVCRRLNELPPNLALLAHLDSIARAAQGNGLAVIAVAGLETRKTYERFVARRQFDLTIPIAFDTAMTTFLPYPDGYHFGLPAEAHIYIIGSDGKLAARIDRFQTGDDELETSLKSLGVQFRKPSDCGELPNSVWANALEDHRATAAFR